MEKQSDYGYGSAKPQSSDIVSSQEPKESSAPKTSSNEPVLLKVSDLENNPICRICYNGPSRERLVRPCKCKAGMKKKRVCKVKLTDATAGVTKLEPAL
ncbi:e3 ubiquitin-protein ligase MARCH3 [Trichonephila clavipes]|nr:e3 ubiquitin-protein ligase MARCH3 [Trichonephila clavipes]